jgi:hypothetical protein
MRIRPLTKRQEKQVLASMLAGLNEPPDNRWQTRLKREVIGMSIPVLLAVVFLGVLRSQSWLTVFTTASALISGLTIGIRARRTAAAKQWPTVARCLDRDKIERRLRELDG